MKLIKLLLCTLLMFACSGDDNLMDSGSKKGCDCLQGEKMSEVVNVDATLIIIYGGPPDMGILLPDGPYIIYVQGSENAILNLHKTDALEDNYLICNLPNSIKQMDVNSEGIDVVLSGNVYSSKTPVAEGEYFYFELTKLKNKQQ